MGTVRHCKEDHCVCNVGLDVGGGGVGLGGGGGGGGVGKNEEKRPGMTRPQPRKL